MENDVVDKELYRKASHTSIENAFDIFEEAALLYDKEKYARAFSICILSLEELAKSFIYRCISVGLLDEKGIRNILLNHNTKIVQSGHLMTFTILFVHYSDEFNEALKHDLGKDHEEHIYPDILSKRSFESANEVIETLEFAQKIKLDTIFVDIREGKIIDPKEVIDKEKCKKTLANAGMVLGLMKPLIENDDELFAKDTKKFLSHVVDGIKREVEDSTKKKPRKKERK